MKYAAAVDNDNDRDKVAIRYTVHMYFGSMEMIRQAYMAVSTAEQNSIHKKQRED
jgi:hypothetical protein